MVNLLKVDRQCYKGEVSMKVISDYHQSAAMFNVNILMTSICVVNLTSFYSLVLAGIVALIRFYRS